MAADVTTANELMRVVDDAIREALAARGLQAFRFDADVNTEEGWVRVKVKIREATVEQSAQPLWGFKCRACDATFSHADRKRVAAELKSHRAGNFDHDAWMYCIPQE